MSYVAKLFDSELHGAPRDRALGIPEPNPDLRRRALRSDDGLRQRRLLRGGELLDADDIIDMQTGTIVTDLEKLTVFRNGERFHNRNFNFWESRSRSDDDHFYATLGSGGNTYLVVGASARARCASSTTTSNVRRSLPTELGSRSSGASNSHGNWRLYVLDLRTMKETPLAERESIDDQAEWLDNTHVTLLARQRRLGSAGERQRATAQARHRRVVTRNRQAVKSVASGSRLTAQERRGRPRRTRIPRDSASAIACGFSVCAARMPRQPRFAGSSRMKPR